MTDANMLTQVEHAQNAWANGLIAIGEAYLKGQDYQASAEKLIHTLYNFNHNDGMVLFKPTKASINPFRDTFEGALSYFIGNNPAYEEDQGFALVPWTHIAFKNHQISTYFHRRFVLLTENLWNRNPTLYPAELRAHI